MPLHAFLLVLEAASALLAGWIVVRFPGINPTGAHRITIAIVGAAFVPIAVVPLIGVVGEPLGAVAALILVVLPGSTYLFLVAAWIMLFVKRAIEPYVR